MASNGNGKVAPAGMVVPEIKFTKLFINGDFVASQFTSQTEG
jgi:coniferyl-aldehyde dehydrogenase